MNPRPDNTWPSAHTVWYEDSDDIQPRVWVPLALAMVLGIGLLVAFVLHRDESAPVAVEVSRP